jgi:multicomponent Na+:H+ antiporter subunit E
MTRGGMTMVPAAAWRACLYLLLWLLLAGWHASDLPALLPAVAAATWTSLLLLPPGAWRLSLAGIALLALRFPAQSILAGVDVARRALHPDLKLHPGFVPYRPLLAPGLAREGFCTFASLLPGTLPTGTDSSGALLIHCLDVGQPVAAAMAIEERRFLRALGRADRSRDG